MNVELKLRICIALLLLTLPAVFRGQNLTDLENEAMGASGMDRLEKLFIAIDASVSQQDFERVIRLAEEAAATAKRQEKPLYRAQALHYSGIALSHTGKKKKLFRKESPETRFEQSNEILQKIKATSDPLFVLNLEQLYALAKRDGQVEKAAQLEDQLARVKHGGDLSSPVTRQELRQELNQLNKELQRQRLDKDTTKAFARRMLQQSQALQAQLAQKEAALSQMSEGQIKVEYMLLKQSQMLDSLLYRSRVDSLMLSNQNLALKEAQASRNFTFAIALFLLMLCGGVLYSFIKARQNAWAMAEKNRVIDQEKQRSETLLLNILPAAVADELKLKGSTSARYFDDVSVLFADFVNFTSIAERITPQQLVNDLDTCFKAFDQIIVSRGLEKIKTIGDAYLCAGGLNQQGNNQVVQMVHAARDMQNWLNHWNRERAEAGLPLYQARIGIHRGSVVAGVVGAQKFAFDIWGDTVNIAARIEQAGEAGKINLSGAAYEALRNEIACNFRGKIPVKNKGEIEMFFVES